MRGDFDKKAIVTRVDKRGEWYTVEGRVDGKDVSVDISAPDVESRSRKDAESLMRRSLYGTAKGGAGEHE